jgi:hypothetical protein
MTLCLSISYINERPEVMQAASCGPEGVCVCVCVCVCVLQYLGMEPRSKGRGCELGTGSWSYNCFVMHKRVGFYLATHSSVCWVLRVTYAHSDFGMGKKRT